MPNKKIYSKQTADAIIDSLASKGFYARLVKRTDANGKPYWFVSGRKNPSLSLGGDSGGWQAAHAFRQLSDGRVQILTNPGGRVPKIKVNKNPNTTNAVLLKGWWYWDTAHYPRRGNFHRATRDIRVTVLKEVNIPYSNPEYQIEFIGNDNKKHTANVDVRAIKFDK